MLKGFLLCLLLIVVGGSAIPQAAAPPRAFTWYVPILTYHFTVCAPPGTPQASRYLYVCPEVFKAQLQAVLNDGWTFITAAQFAALFVVGFHPWPKTVVLTIDGTEAGDYEVAFPILKEMGIKATFFVSPGRLGRPGLETWDNVREMHRDGQDIENHGMYHRSLTSLHGAALRYEIAAASDAIESHLGYRPTVFCYPNGVNNAEDRQALAEVDGLVMAPSTHVIKPFSQPLEDSTKPFQVIRLSAQPVLPSVLLELIEPYAAG